MLNNSDFVSIKLMSTALNWNPDAVNNNKFLFFKQQV